MRITGKSLLAWLQVANTFPRYEATLAELDMLRRTIRPDDLLMGHDYYSGCPAWPAVNEWCARKRQRIAWPGG